MVFLFPPIQDSQRPLLAAVVPHPTGTNGYEDYLRAVDAFDLQEFQRTRTWLTYLGGSQAASTVPPIPSGISLKDTDYTVRLHVLDEFGDCLQWIHAGNLKIVSDPRSGASKGIAPETTPFRYLGLLESDSIKVDFAKGDTSKAVADLEDGMNFAMSIQLNNTMSMLNGGQVLGDLLAELSDHLPQLSLSDARSLGAFALKKLAAPSSAKSVLAKWASDITSRLTSVIDHIPEAASEFDQDAAGEGTRLAKQLQAMSPTQLSEANTKLASDVTERLNAVLSELDGPETGLVPITPKLLPTPEKLDVVGRIERQAGLDSFGLSILTSEARTRIWLRLLYLTCKAVEYRWQNGRLPTRIEQFASPNECVDATTGQLFQFEREGFWFSISRKSQDRLGDLQLGAHWKPYSYSDFQAKP